MNQDKSTWNMKYWDAADQFFWAPQYVGMASIPKSLWTLSDSTVTVPRELVNPSGPLYRRIRKAENHFAWMRTQEEVLNHVFDIAFGIAPDALISRFFLQPLNIDDAGPFVSLGREVRDRYGWGASENVTQHDGLFVSSTSAVGVELKLSSTSTPGQILKYAALLAWEESATGPRDHLGLLFILPASKADRHWRSCGLSSPEIDASFLARHGNGKLPNRIRSLIDTRPDDVVSVLERMRLHLLTWEDLRDACEAARTELDPVRPGDQALERLLAGLTSQISEHLSAIANPLQVTAEDEKGGVNGQGSSSSGQREAFFIAGARLSGGYVLTPPIAGKERWFKLGPALTGEPVSRGGVEGCRIVCDPSILKRRGISSEEVSALRDTRA